MTIELDVAIIGAGPYGLSIAAHLDARGVENQVFGPIMDSWQNHMPAGMCLKSYGESSNIFDPEEHFTLERYCRQSGIDYHATNLPVRLETFVAYGKAFQARYVPHVQLKKLVSYATRDRRHLLGFDDGESVLARRVVVATGVVAYRYMPPNLFAALPPELLSHSADHGSIGHLADKSVTVVGRGASALDLAALLALQGARATLVTRGPELKFQTVPPSSDLRESALRDAARKLLRPPARGLGSGWILLACAATPRLIRMSPDRTRVSILNTYLGPSGGYFIREIIDQRVQAKLGRTIERVQEVAGRVRVTAVDPQGRRETIESDHLVAATGYRVDLRSLGFLGAEALGQLRMLDHVPVLSTNFESSIPGLYFCGLTSARSFGPIMRFVEGAIHPARALARVLSKSRSRLQRPAAISVPG